MTRCTTTVHNAGIASRAMSRFVSKACRTVRRRQSVTGDTQISFVVYQNEGLTVLGGSWGSSWSSPLVEHGGWNTMGSDPKTHDALSAVAVLASRKERWTRTARARVVTRLGNLAAQRAANLVVGGNVLALLCLKLQALLLLLLLLLLRLLAPSLLLLLLLLLRPEISSGPS